jgi:transposase
MNTKLHAITDAEGRPLRFFMTAGQVQDLSVEVPHYEEVAQQFHTMHLGFDAASAVVTTLSSPERTAEVF